MGGKDHVQLGIRPSCAKFFEITRSDTESGHALCSAFGRDQIAHPVCACLERTCFEFGDKLCKIIQRELAGFQFAGKVVRKLEDRIEKRCFLGPLMQFTQAMCECRESEWLQACHRCFPGFPSVSVLLR